MVVSLIDCMKANHRSRSSALDFPSKVSTFCFMDLFCTNSSSLTGDGGGREGYGEREKERERERERERDVDKCDSKFNCMKANRSSFISLTVPSKVATFRSMDLFCTNSASLTVDGGGEG